MTSQEKYIFISYAHKDSAIVVPLIANMRKSGFHVWYDNGIETGTEWPDYIQTRLEKSAAVLVFISKHSVESVNCRNEINFALMKHKAMIVVHLEETELKYGMGLQLNGIQSVSMFKYAKMSKFFEELISIPLLQVCREKNESPAPAAAEEKGPVSHAGMFSYETMLKNSLSKITKLIPKKDGLNENQKQTDEASGHQNLLRLATDKIKKEIAVYIGHTDTESANAHEEEISNQTENPISSVNAEEKDVSLTENPVSDAENASDVIKPSEEKTANDRSDEAYARAKNEAEIARAEAQKRRKQFALLAGVIACASFVIVVAVNAALSANRSSKD